jgi:hypothetical protein
MKIRFKLKTPFFTKTRVFVYSILALTMLLTACITTSFNIFLTKPDSWPIGIIPFQFEEGFDSESRVMAYAAMVEWEIKTDRAVKFVSRTNQSNYIEFSQLYPKECSSYVGMAGGKQEVNISLECGYGDILHELGHVLGLFHEHQRFDRDKYIKINLENVKNSRRQKNQFALIPSWVYSTSTPYDFKSIMHYDAFAFSKNDRPTIELKQGGAWYFGFSNSVSEIDALKIKELYGK